MVLNKKGQTFFVGLMVAILMLIMVINFIPTIKQEITTARGVDYLDCTNTSITDSNKMVCLVSDLYLLSFVGLGLFVAISYIGLKKYGFIGRNNEE